jgi:glycosyltransferase involved in cell wall biosynthesis
MDPSTLSVSIAMATYNGQRHIRRQLDSLTAQTKLPAELVVTDDCSEDDTVDIINAFAKTAPFPVTVHRNEARLGYRANFMRAANLCRSDLIAFCDQDDDWYPQKLAVSVKPFSDPEVLLSYHNADVVTEDGRRIGFLADRAGPISSGPWHFVPGFTQVFVRSLLLLSSYWPDSRDSIEDGERSAHDKWFFFLATVFGKIIYLEEPLVAYVQHGGNTYGWTQLRLIEWVKYIFRDRAVEISNFAKAAENRSVILDNAKVKFEGIWREQAASAAEYYRELCALCSERRSLYASKSLGGRLRAFRGVLRRSGYASDWGLGPRALILDLCLGVAFGPLLRSDSG